MLDVLKRGKIHSLSIQCQLDLFDKMIKPMLLYGCEVCIADSFVCFPLINSAQKDIVLTCISMSRGYLPSSP
jgi:hypothetical protein